jgi:hypothetical protein
VLTASSPVTSLAIYQGNTVVVMPLEEYKLDNIRLARLINALEEQRGVDSVRQLRIQNYEMQLTAKDSIIAKETTQRLLALNAAWDAKEETLYQKNKKKTWRRVAVIEAAILTAVGVLIGI